MLDRQAPLRGGHHRVRRRGGRDLRDIDELVGLVAEVGLDASEARTVLKTGRYADAVRADRHLAAAHGVTAIPTYIVPGQPPIHGAKRPAILVQALRAAAAKPQD